MTPATSTAPPPQLPVEPTELSTTPGKVLFRQILNPAGPSSGQKRVAGLSTRKRPKGRHTAVPYVDAGPDDSPNSTPPGRWAIWRGRHLLCPDHHLGSSRTDPSWWGGSACAAAVAGIAAYPRQTDSLLPPGGTGDYCTLWREESRRLQAIAWPEEHTTLAHCVRAISRPKPGTRSHTVDRQRQSQCAAVGRLLETGPPVG